ncbi:hypothetical protein GN956_G23632 [Arapaima gigas]
MKDLFKLWRDCPGFSGPRPRRPDVGRVSTGTQSVPPASVPHSRAREAAQPRDASCGTGIGRRCRAPGPSLLLGGGAENLRPADAPGPRAGWCGLVPTVRGYRVALCLPAELFTLNALLTE